MTWMYQGTHISMCCIRNTGCNIIQYTISSKHTHVYRADTRDASCLLHLIAHGHEHTDTNEHAARDSGARSSLKICFSGAVEQRGAIFEQFGGAG